MNTLVICLPDPEYPNRFPEKGLLYLLRTTSSAIELYLKEKSFLQLLGRVAKLQAVSEKVPIWRRRIFCTLIELRAGNFAEIYNEAKRQEFLGLVSGWLPKRPSHRETSLP